MGTDNHKIDRDAYVARGVQPTRKMTATRNFSILVNALEAPAQLNLEITGNEMASSAQLMFFNDNGVETKIH